MKRLCMGLILWLSMLLPAVVMAQSTNAALTGTVADISQAVVPGATVSTQNILTGVVLTTTTNEAGVYNFPSLQPGKYRVTAEKDGFKKLS